jgi:hypothetical protein
MARKKESLTAAVSAELRSKFDLSNFKNKKGLDKNIKFKEQQWIPLSSAFQEVTSIPGIPMGHIVLLRGHSDTGKTTAMIEAAVSAQKRNILPVFIITEMKWNWEHAIQMGLDIKVEKHPETGEIVGYDGNFIYIDRETINSIEDVAGFILDLMDEQKKGNLPYDLLFLWDSIGSVPCEMSLKSNKNNNEWNAGAMSTQFGNNVKGGYAMWFDSTFVVTFGNIMSAGTSKIKAIKDGKQVEFAKRANIQIDKNHINGVTTRGRIVMTPHGFILDSDKDLKEYKSNHAAEWSKILGGMDFDVVEENEEVRDISQFEKEPE